MFSNYFCFTAPQKRMVSVAKRIAVLEGQIEGMVAELAMLKLAIPPPLSLPPPALSLNIFAPIKETTVVDNIKEVFVLFDFETGGLGKTSDIRICQIGAIALSQNMEVLGEFDEFVNPRRDISPGATAVNNITNDFVKFLDDWSKVGLRFNQWIAGFAKGLQVTLCAHNGKRFVEILYFITLILTNDMSYTGSTEEFSRLKIPDIV